MEDEVLRARWDLMEREAVVWRSDREERECVCRDFMVDNEQVERASLVIDFMLVFDSF